jgi:hypothetical protein
MNFDAFEGLLAGGEAEEGEADAGVAMNARARFVITFSPAPHVDAIRSLRRLLKIAKRHLGLIATDAYENRTSLLPISNRLADEFRDLRNEIISERANQRVKGSCP